MSRTDLLVQFDAHGILPTPQRLEIAEILFEKPQHLSADNIIERLRQNGSNVSKATVYNTLNLFVDRGIVNECLIDSERRFYDSVTAPHHHFYNVDTGELTDIDADAIVLGSLPPLPDGTETDCVEVTIKVHKPR